MLTNIPTFREALALRVPHEVRIWLIGDVSDKLIGGPRVHDGELNSLISTILDQRQ